MQRYNLVSLVIGLAIFILSFWGFFLIVKSFTVFSPGNENQLGFKGHPYVVVRRFVLDSASGSLHIETRLLNDGKEGPVINLEVISANQYQTKQKVTTKSEMHLER